MVSLPYRVFQRVGRSGKKTWSARFLTPEGELLRTKSFPKAKTRNQALAAAGADFDKGVVASANNPKLEVYLRDFWKMDSDYCRSKALRGHPLSVRYVEDCLNAAETHVIPTLGPVKVGDLTAKVVEAWLLERNKAGIKNSRLNTALKSLRVPVVEFCRLNRLQNPLSTVKKLLEKPTERGILTVEELGKIVLLNESPRIKTGILLAAFCGLRAGEVRGLQWVDIDWNKKEILVQHNWVCSEEETKDPKWHKLRTVVVPELVLDSLRFLQEVNLKGSPFVLFNQDRNDRPLEMVSLRNGFNRTVGRVGIDNDSKKKRNLCFHGLRNFFITNCRSQGIPDYLVQRMAGHSTMEMTEHYTRVNTVDFESARSKLEAQGNTLRAKKTS
jgi:integrase